MKYYSALAKAKFSIPEKPLLPNWSVFKFFNFVFDFIILSFYALANKRFRKASNLAFTLWLGAWQEVEFEKNKKNSLIQKQIKNLRIKNAERIHSSLSSLGAAFIKVGQFLSVREDIVPAEYVDKLASLQDYANPLPIETIINILEKSLKAPVGELFSSIEEKPLASASIGQVHKAITLSGKEIVLKVQRPDLEEIFLEDISIARAFSVFFERHIAWVKNKSWPEICDEFGKVLFEEIDFKQEALNAERMRLNLCYDHTDLIIPQVSWDFVSKNTLALEYVPGYKINDTKALIFVGNNKDWICKKLLDIFYDQFFKHGFFHADPHPGNIAINEEGKLILYDFGMTYKIDQKVRDNFQDAILALVSQNTNKLINTLSLMGLLRDGADLELLGKVIQKTTYKYYSGGNFKELNLDNIKEDINKIIADNPIHMPPSLAYFFRTIGLLEGLCRGFNPNFDFIMALKPYSEKWLNSSSKTNIIEKMALKIGGKALAENTELIGLLALPMKALELIDKINNGNLQVPINLQPLEKKITHIENITKGIAFMFLGTIILLASVGAFQLNKLDYNYFLIITSLGSLLLLFGFKLIIYNN